MLPLPYLSGPNAELLLYVSACGTHSHLLPPVTGSDPLLPSVCSKFRSALSATRRQAELQLQLQPSRFLILPRRRLVGCRCSNPRLVCVGITASGRTPAARWSCRTGGRRRGRPQGARREGGDRVPGVRGGSSEDSVILITCQGGDELLKRLGLAARPSWQATAGSGGAGPAGPGRPRRGAAGLGRQ